MKVGSHLIVNKGIYDHHGIYIGGGKVIHYSGLSDGLRAGPIEVTSLDHFSSGSDIIVREHKNAKFSGKRAIERAISRVGENDYDLHSNNCEHFCNWVIHGKSRSSQVNIAEDVADIIIPNSTVLSLLKVRKHSKQKDTDTSELAVDVAEKVALGAMMTVVPVTIPVVAAVKIFKWLTK